MVTSAAGVGSGFSPIFGRESGFNLKFTDCEGFRVTADSATVVIQFQVHAIASAEMLPILADGHENLAIGAHIGEFAVLRRASPAALRVTTMILKGTSVSPPMQTP